MRHLLIALTALAVATPSLAQDKAAPATPDAGNPAAATAPDAAKKAPPSPRVPPSSERFVFVPSGVDRTIGFMSQLRPDCASLGSTDYRVELKPEHGTITFGQEENYASYPMNSPMQRCNDQKAAGLATHYKSADGYLGEDSISVLYLLPSATAIEIKYTILVK